MYEAAIDGDEEYFNQWLLTMKQDDVSITTIKSEIEKLDQEQYSVLHYAIRYNQLHLAQKFIEEFRCDVNLAGLNGETPLHTAARYTQTKLTRENAITCLVNYQADISKRDYYGRTPLHHAAMRNNCTNAKQLIELNAPIDIIDQNHASPLHLASRFDATDCVRLFLEQGAQIDRQDANGNTPLHCLALSPSIVKNKMIQNTTAYLLLDIAKDRLDYYLEMFNHEDKTALSLACEHGNQDLVRILLLYGANAQNCMTIHMAIKSGNPDIVQYLLESQMKHDFHTSFHMACQYNRTDILRMLIDHSSDHSNIEIRDHRGYTPLLTASYYNHHDCMQILLSNGANLFAVDYARRNILHICVEKQCNDALKTCLECIKNDIDSYELFTTADRYGNTVLHTAANYGSHEICEVLMNVIKHILFLSGSDENTFHQQYLSLILKKNRNQRTSIHEAAKIGNFALMDCVFRILEANVQHKFTVCEAVDDEFKTSLHLAAGEGHDKIVQFLLAQGANVCVCDMNDVTPMHEAAAHNCRHCVEILLQNGSSINQFDGKHHTPLHRASQHGHWEIVRLLLNSNVDVRLVNCDGYNSLEIAIVNNCQLTVREFLQHETWMKSLRNCQMEVSSNRKYEDLSTPLRKLIRYMPNEAEEVFTRCITELGGSEDPSYKIIFNYEFLEDQFAIQKWKQDCYTLPGDSSSIKINKWNPLHYFKKQTNASLFDHHIHSLRQNHPLYLIITYHQHDLLKNPLIERLITRKWVQFSRSFFWILFLFYGFFLASFTFTILRVRHPQYYYSLFNASISLVSCETISLNLLRHESFILIKKNFYDTMIKWLLLSTILIHVVKNVLLICIRFRMFFGLSNILELIALILSIIFSHDFYSWQMSIRFRCSLQWQCGAIGILIAWITLITYVQFLWASGIYVVMLEVIVRKFLRFIPILLIFILGFGLSFHMLLQNQSVYHHTFDALIRTVLMLTGEFNYEEHIYRGENENGRYYYEMVFLLYVLFCILITILIMNLLIANAVGEIPPLIEHAQAKHSIMRVKLIMNYEIFLSTFDCLIPYLKQRARRLIEKNQNEIIYPNKISRYKYKYYQLKKFFDEKRKKSFE
ncbi:unnamed protein product [Adineta ricciae]|uniref:Uncharacterized protein n=1 Tax=Adineta ricciae TaxID=249248 RepID=A0A813QUF8_ADIRI|nr:unnamed protein product [Adineta ricciae]CAF1176161.1 unnamed protein product [Adineta ricciae]